MWSMKKIILMPKMHSLKSNGWNIKFDSEVIGRDGYGLCWGSQSLLSAC